MYSPEDTVEFCHMRSVAAKTYTSSFVNVVLLNKHQDQ
jgi:hypothetical protein